MRSQEASEVTKVISIDYPAEIGVFNSEGRPSRAHFYAKLGLPGP
jgi:hypothetical protein